MVYVCSLHAGCRNIFHWIRTIPTKICFELLPILLSFFLFLTFPMERSIAHSHLTAYALKFSSQANLNISAEKYATQTITIKNGIDFGWSAGHKCAISMNYGFEMQNLLHGWAWQAFIFCDSYMILFFCFSFTQYIFSFKMFENISICRKQSRFEVKSLIKMENQKWAFSFNKKCCIFPHRTRGSWHITWWHSHIHKHNL